MGDPVRLPGNDIAAPLTNDVFKDRRGLLWVTDKERGSTSSNTKIERALKDGFAFVP